MGSLAGIVHLTNALISPNIGDAGTTAGPPGHRGKCPTSGRQDSPDRAKDYFGSKKYGTKREKMKQKKKKNPSKNENKKLSEWSSG